MNRVFHDGAFSMPLLPEDRLPPQNLEAERGVIGAALLDNATLHETALIVSPGDFYRDNHQILWRAILDLYDASSPIDSLILIDELNRLDLYAKAGGDDAIKEILDGLPHAANATYHAKIVRQKAISRGLIDAANEILRENYAGNHTSDELLERAETRVFAITDNRVTSETHDAGELTVKATKVIEMRKQGECFGSASQWPDLDDLTGGFPPGYLIVVAARPSMGKTAFALNLAEHASFESRDHVLFVSLEMDGVSIAQRMLVSQGRVDGHRVQTGELDHDQWDRLTKAQARIIERSRFRIDDSPTRTVSQIGANARREKSRNGLDLIVIDYLQLIQPSGGLGKNTRRDEVVAEQTRRLKALARELKIPVILLSQLNRKAEERENHEPRMADLRESGATEQDADMVLLLHRPDYYDPNDDPGLAKVIVAKNRNGRTGSTKLTYLKQFMRFESYCQPIRVANVGDEPF